MATFGKWNRGPSDSVEEHAKRAQVQKIFRRLVLVAYPNLSKDGMSALTELRNKSIEKYNQFFEKARIEAQLGLTEIAPSKPVVVSNLPWAKSTRFGTRRSSCGE